MEDLIKLDKHFWLEASFLMDQSDSLIEGHMRSCMLDVLRNGGKKGMLTKACMAARTLATGAVAMAQRKSVIDNLGNAANALLDISMCSGPTAKELGAMSHWLQCFHKRAEHVCHVYAEVDEGGIVSRRSFSGAAAMRWRFDTCSGKQSGH